MITLEVARHDGHGVVRRVYDIESIDNENCTINGGSSFKECPEKFTFSDRRKFEQLVQCGYTFVVSYGDVYEYIIKNC